MIIRRCEYCRKRLPIGMRVDAMFCGDNCRINAHKHRKRKIVREWKLTDSYHPIVSFPMHPLWEPLIKEMQNVYPEGYIAVGYRLMKKGSIYPNPNERLRAIDNDLRSDPFYHWRPFEPPSVPEAGDYKLQWWVGPDAVHPDFSAEKVPRCYVPIGDPQARFHQNHPSKERISPVAWKRQVQLKMRLFK